MGETVSSKRFVAWATPLRHKGHRAVVDFFTRTDVRMFLAVFFAIYIVNFIVVALATTFREILRVWGSIANGSYPTPSAEAFWLELEHIFLETTGPFMDSGIAGILVIMLFIAGIAYLLTIILISLQRDASEKQRLFAANASHELRTPLSILKTISEVMRMRLKNLTKDELEKFTEDIIEEVDRMTGIIEFFVYFTALEDRGRKLQMTSIPLSQVSESAVRSLAHFAAEHDVEVVVKKPVGGIIHGNYTAIEEMLINLLKNAIAHTPHGGRVRLATEINDTRVCCSIVDNGTGIAPEDLPHIFEPFYRSANKARKSGSGLGLTLVKQIVKLHRASIDVKSTLGEGSTFTVCFPKP